MAVSVITSWSTDLAWNFIGYYYGPSTTSPLWAGSYWVTSGTYAGDCSTTAASDCIFATECINNVLYHDNGASTSCGDGSSCVSMTIFQTSPDGNPSATNINCRPEWQAYTIYRELEVFVTITDISTTISATSTASPASKTTASVVTTTSTPAADSPSKSSEGWIAGAVIGPIAVIALLFLAYWLWRRRRRQSYTSTPPGLGPSPPAELHGQQRSPYELSSAENKPWVPLAELPASNLGPELPTK